MLKKLNFLLFEHHFMVSLLLKCSLDPFHSTLQPGIKVLDLVIEEPLEHFHFPLHIPELSLVNLAEYSTACLFNGLYSLPLDFEYLVPNIPFKTLEQSFMYNFAFNLKF